MYKTLLLIVLCLCLMSSIAVAQNKNVNQSPGRKNVIKDPFAKNVADYLSRSVPFGFSGAILIAKNDQVILQSAYGLANRKRRIPVTTDTVFYIGSLTKQFTAAAIIKLEMQGKLRVTDTLDTIFKDVPIDKAKITIHQLLTHSSGLGDSEDKYGAPIGKEAQLKRIMEMKLDSEPGKQYSYSNAGYSLLGIIVETVSGQPYEQYLHENLFKPAGMFMTGYRVPKWDKSKVMHGYSGDIDKGSPLDRPWLADGPSWALRGAGGMLSTLGDLYRWHLALKKDEILSAEAKRKIFSPQIKSDSEGFYGYGWSIQKTPRGTNLIEHNGSDGIFYAVVRRYVDENTIVIGATNDIYGAGILDSKVPEIVFGNDKIQFPPMTSAKEAAPALLQKYVGEYQLPSGATIKVTLKSNRLILDPVGQEAVSLITDVQPPQAENFEKISSKAEEILSGAINNDFTALKANIASGKFEGFKAYLTEVLDLSKDKSATPAKYKVIGTHPLWFASGKPVTTFVRVNNKEGANILFITWENNQIRGRGMGAESDDASLRTPFVARSQKSFTGFHQGIAKSIDINFRTNQKGEVAAIEFHTPKGIISAKLK